MMSFKCLFYIFRSEQARLSTLEWTWTDLRHIKHVWLHKQAHRMRPNDSRLLIALGEAYEKLDRPRCAAKCYERARQLGDDEGLAILNLAK